MLLTHKDLLLKTNELESKMTNHDKSIKQVFEYLKQLIQDDVKPRKSIGFKQKGRK
jgi:phosphomevalonate kinase